MNTKTLLTILILTLTCTHARANDPLEVGKPCPDLKLSEVHYYTKKAVLVSDFKGKWLVLDFFSRGCLSCFESFPKMNKLRAEFKDKMEIMLVGYDDDKIRPVYERFRTRQNLNLPVVYDSAIFKTFKIRAVPYIIVVDPDGIVKALTTSLDRQNIIDLLQGKDSRLQEAKNADEIKRRSALYDASKPLLINNNGGYDTAFLFRSVLTQWDGIIFGASNRHIDRYNKNKVQVVGLPIQVLYMIAYGDTTHYAPRDPSPYGKWWKFPIVESKDAALEFNWSFPENKYNYSLIVPLHKASTQYLKEVMQRDLKNYFGYDVTVEKRMMPCWKLVATEKAKANLRSKGGKIVISNSIDTKSLKLSNVPVAMLISQLWLYNQMEPPFIDETAIEDNIDLELEVLHTDFNDWQRALKKVGLSLVKGEREMNVIVIRDPT